MGKIGVGENFNPENCIFSFFLPYIFQFLPLNLQFIPKIVQILTIFPKKANLENISQKSTILDNFPFLKVKNMGKFFHNFFAGWGKNRFLWQNIHLCNQVSSFIQSANDSQAELFIVFCYWLTV